MRNPKLHIFSLFLFTFVQFSTSIHTLTSTHPLRDGETLVSADGSFRLGFFTPGYPPNRYLAIWFNRIPVQTPVWIANRDRPLLDRSGLLSLSRIGHLSLLNSTGSIFWSSDPNPTPKPTRRKFRNPIAQLLDTGNLIIRDRSDNLHVSVTWQSFDFPTDTWLPGMRLSSLSCISSWKNGTDPALGEYSVTLDDGSPQVSVSDGTDRIYRTGPWKDRFRYPFMYAFNPNQSYLEYRPNNPSAISRFVIDGTGFIHHSVWSSLTGVWEIDSSSTKEDCDVHGRCGPNGVCRRGQSAVCECLVGFEPVLDREGSGGCRRRSGLGCGESDGFRKVGGLKVPDMQTAIVNHSLGLGECENACRRNCDCVAYFVGDLIGCAMWVGDLMDLSEFSDGGLDIYVRLAASEFDDDDDDDGGGQLNSSFSKTKHVIIIAALISLTLLLLQNWVCLLLRKRVQDQERSRYLSVLESGANLMASVVFGNGDAVSDDESNYEGLTSYSLATLASATEEFADMNKLGEGGFGPVYKGKFSNGQEVAVKRLSHSSMQGLKEFKNEVLLIARLQHVNLVRLLGFCMQGGEKMLVYEYMHNNSLDTIIFDSSKGVSLDWGKRMRILNGIAQGLLYLHKYSRLKIIHRDLKASNILLDADFNPKISDFGMARLFGGDQNQGNTSRIVGTFGYMPPEYAVRGHFSEKSDVFSFGVLLLEIVSGMRNAGFTSINHSWNLLAYAWELWVDGRALQLVDPVLDDSDHFEEEKLKCIQIGLLCVEQSADERPKMSTVVSLLTGTNENLPSPRQPAFSTKTDHSDKQHSDPRKLSSSCSNDVTISVVEAR